MTEIQNMTNPLKKKPKRADLRFYVVFSVLVWVFCDVMLHVSCDVAQHYVLIPNKKRSNLYFKNIV